MKLKLTIASNISCLVIILLFIVEIQFSKKDMMVNPEILFGLSIYGLVIAIVGATSSILWIKGKLEGKKWQPKIVSILLVVVTILSSTCILFCSMILGSSSSYVTIKSIKHDKVFKLIGEFCPTDIVYKLVSSRKEHDFIYKILADGQISYSEDGSLISDEKMKLSAKEKYLAIIRNGYMTDLYNIVNDSIESDSSYLFSTHQDTSIWKRHSKTNEDKFNSDN